MRGFDSGQGATSRGRWTLVALLGAVGGLCLVMSTPGWALRQTIRAKTLTVPDAPVLPKDPTVTLVEVYGTPTQIPIPGTQVQQRRVKYANRAGVWPSSYLLQGEVWCHNRSEERIEALALSVVFLDAFSQTVRASMEGGSYSIQKIVQPLPRGSSLRVAWEQPVTSPEIYEVAVLITSARFADGTIWTAPQEQISQLLFGDSRTQLR